LAEAATTIDELGQQAQVQRTLLATKQEEADRALTDIQVGHPVHSSLACNPWLPRQLHGGMILLKRTCMNIHTVQCQVM
jgi:hypothetical protein